MEQKNSSRRSQPVPAATILLAALILGISLIISAAVIGSSVKKLTAAVSEQTFASTFSSPSSLSVATGAPKTYFNTAEAAEYLKITEPEIKAAITKGEIDKYVATSTGYTISKESLDKYFDSRAYAQMMSDNSSD